MEDEKLTDLAEDFSQETNENKRTELLFKIDKGVKENIRTVEQAFATLEDSLEDYLYNQSGYVGYPIWYAEIKHSINLLKDAIERQRFENEDTITIPKNEYIELKSDKKKLEGLIDLMKRGSK